MADLKAELWSKIGDHLASSAIFAAVKVGIAGALRSGPRRSDEMAAELGVDKGLLGSLLGLLSSEGIFEEPQPGCFQVTEVGKLLDDPEIRDRILDRFEVELPYFLKLDEALRTGRPVFETAHGTPFYGFLAGHSRFSRTFHTVLGRAGPAAAELLSRSFDFTTVARVVDVGGGNGSTLSSLLLRWPHLKGTLLDSPSGLRGASELIQSSGLEPRCMIEARDFFNSRLPSGDVLLLQWILCDWSDQDSLRILRNCSRSMAAGGRLLILESVGGPGSLPANLRALDLLLRITLGGRVRSHQQIADLVEEAGLRLVRASPTDRGSTVFEVALDLESARHDR